MNNLNAQRKKYEKQDKVNAVAGPKQGAKDSRAVHSYFVFLCIDDTNSTEKAHWQIVQEATPHGDADTERQDRQSLLERSSPANQSG